MNKNYYETDKYVFFYGSCYSQWAMGGMEIDGNLFNCCEQFMMCKKADLFKDKESFKKIWSSGDPAVQKALGRKVKNFDKDKWEAIARDVVYEANYAKFTQNEDWKQQLLRTGDKIIVEASPTDCIWGIGMSCDDPGITDPKNWRGTNWLGEAIMKVREQIKKETIQMAKKEENKPVGPVIYGPKTLNGKRVSLVRGGKEVKGVLMSQDGQNQNDNLVFKWTNDHGTASISPLTGEELEALQKSG